MSAPLNTPRKPTDDPLLAVIGPALKVGAFSGEFLLSPLLYCETSNCHPWMSNKRINLGEMPKKMQENGL